jgi:hypothetical protein
MSMEIVVSHYNENLEWLKEHFPDVSHRIYSKSGLAGTFVLPNVGFEAQTWFQHFAMWYEDLPDVTVCLQGNPFPHAEPGWVKVILSIKPDRFSFRPLCTRYWAWNFSDGRPHHPEGLPELQQLWHRFFGTWPPDMFCTNYGGMFAVHREIVRRLPREFYETGAELIKTKQEACAVERMWHYIFSGT